MSSVTWTSAISADWNSASLWAPAGVPNDGTSDVSIGAAGTYVVTIGAGETEAVATVAVPDQGATLSVGGDLQLYGTPGSSYTPAAGTIAVNFTGTLEGSGPITSPLDNAGLVNADDGGELALFGTVTNTGTLAVSDGILFVGVGITNLSGSVLTGGTYVSYGTIAPGTTADLNQMVFGYGFTAVLAVDDATIILDGNASTIKGFANGAEATLESQLQTIASGGTLELLENRGFIAGNALTDAGLLLLNGNTLSTPGLTISNGGTFAGYGTVVGSVANNGAVIANGGTLGSLLLDSAINGTGSITVEAGSTMVMPGGSAGAMTVDGQLFDTAPLTVAGTIGGTGTVVVENGGSLEIGGSAAVSVSFAGSNVDLTLDHPATFSGTLIGFGQGDTLTLDGIKGSAATIVNGDTLLVMSGGTTLDAVTLAGTYTGATFTATTVGSNTVVTNVSGAPARSDMPIDLVSVTNTIGLSGTVLTEIENEITLAADNWGQYITGAAPLRVALTLVDSGDFGSEIALGSPTDFVTNGQVINGQTVYVPDAIQALDTGNYAAGTTADVSITLIASATNLSNLYINTDPAAGTAVPAGKIDLLSILTHEFGHGLGFLGTANRTATPTSSNPDAGSSETGIYDTFVQVETIDGTISAVFDGANAEAAYGAAINAGSAVPVPLFYQTGSLDVENYYHVAGLNGGVLSTDLMSPALPTGEFVPISNIDLGILQDTGIPVTADVPCYAKGTMIRTTRGDVAVENLTVQDRAVTARGVALPVIWIGHRHVDCRRHPRPERVLPVRIAADAFGPGLPRRDLFVSPNHAIYFDDVLIPARLLINGLTVTQPSRASVDYYHVELTSHDLLLAENLPAESYLDCGDRQMFGNGGVVTAMFADFAGELWEVAGYAPLVLVGPKLDAAVSWLQTQSTRLTTPRPAAAVA